MKITKSFIPDGNRYIYDRGICSSANGFAQIDTGQEAWYYGLWANATTFQVVCYAEGDLTIEQYEDAEEFEASFKQMAERYKTFDWTCNIDTMCNNKIQQAFEAVNLQELFWENQQQKIA